jgi:hypothetical protein
MSDPTTSECSRADRHAGGVMPRLEAHPGGDATAARMLVAPAERFGRTRIQSSVSL